MAACRQPIPVPHWSKFSYTDPSTKIRLVGSLDEMLRLASGRLYIIDYKTARITNHQDALAPMYEAQLNSYAWLAERLGIGITEQLALIYCELMTELDSKDLLALTNDVGFSLRFQTCDMLFPEEMEHQLVKSRKELTL